MNRQSFCHNITCLYSFKVIFDKNCNSIPSRRFIVAGTEITSEERTTQGDPISITIYSIGATPLINILIDILSNECSANVNLMACADDFLAARNLEGLRRWWSVWTEIVPKFGYYLEPKSPG